MTGSAPAPTIKSKVYRLLLFMARSFAFFLIFVFIYSDLAMPAMVEKSDFLMAFYTAGKLIAGGQGHLLYPEPGAHSFAGTGFDIAAHSFLPNLPAGSAAAYMYMPLDAWLFAPFAQLPPAAALLAWQTVSLIALALSLKVNSRIQPGPWFDRLLLCLCFLPAASTLWIGQLGIVLGVLPMTLGLALLGKGRGLAAGLVWSLIILKPQLLLLPLTLCLSMALTGKRRPLAGMVAGAAGIVLLNLITTSPVGFMQWLVSLKTSEAILSDPRAAGLAIPGHLIVSLPHALLLMVASAHQSLAKLVVYSVSGAVFIAGLVKCVALMKAGSNSRSALSLSTLVSLCMLPLVMPHFLLYDLCILIVGLPVIAGLTADDPLGKPLRRIAVLTVIAINIYCLLFLFQVGAPAILVPACFCLAFMELMKGASARADASAPAASTHEDAAEELL